jgi:hypothetical protein
MLSGSLGPLTGSYISFVGSEPLRQAGLTGAQGAPGCLLLPPPATADLAGRKHWGLQLVFLVEERK